MIPNIWKEIVLVTAYNRRPHVRALTNDAYDEYPDRVMADAAAQAAVAEVVTGDTQKAVAAIERVILGWEAPFKEAKELEAVWEATLCAA